MNVLNILTERKREREREGGREGARERENEEWIEAPCCASILYSCLQNLEEKVNKIFEVSSSTKEAHIKSARHMEEVNESIKFINEKSEEMEADRKEKQRQISEIKMK